MVFLFFLFFCFNLDEHKGKTGNIYSSSLQVHTLTICTIFWLLILAVFSSLMQ